MKMSVFGKEYSQIYDLLYKSKDYEREVEYLNKLIKKNYKKKIKIKYFTLQKGDIKDTKSEISKAKKILKYSPKTSPATGIKLFCEWFIKYNEIQ